MLPSGALCAVVRADSESGSERGCSGGSEGVPRGGSIGTIMKTCSGGGWSTLPLLSVTAKTPLGRASLDNWGS
eukprot:14310544-Alexandrium_andersonii.AAC.1